MNNTVGQGIEQESPQIDLPQPSRSQERPELNKQAVSVLVTLRDGRSFKGDLVRYVPSESKIHIVSVKNGLISPVPIHKVKRMVFTESRPMILEDEPLGNNNAAVTLPQERQEFYIRYKDGTEERNETMSHVTDLHGIHFFVAEPYYCYTHLFVPHDAVENYRIGPLLGDALLQRNKLTAEQLEKSLVEQESLRQQRLGDYLTAQSVVTLADLESALKHQASAPNVRLGEALLQDGIITEMQLEEALQKQGADRHIPLGVILLDMGAVSKIELQKTLANKLGIPFVDLRKFTIQDGVSRLIPESLVRRLRIVPLCVYQSKIVVATENPLDRAPLTELQFHCKKYVEPVMAAPEDISWAIDKSYRQDISAFTSEMDGELNALDEGPDIQEVSDSDNVLVKFVNKMIVDAYSQGASDIHIEPYAGKQSTIIRFRKDGALKPYTELPASYRNALVSRLKIMCDLDISERRKPQDGKINFSRYGAKKVELRVATLPTSGGLEDVVMRILANSTPLPIEQLMLSKDNLASTQKLVSKPYGLFLVCGPTGSGKTTTLHSILGYINTTERKIWTAEDPVEITQRGLRQIQVNPKIGLTFAAAMRAFLRADPDVIMVGEMRDKETAATGIEASLTGHLVFSTLHTNSAPESVVRLLDMGMDPFNFADALLGVLAQRLAKRLCPSCKEAYEPDESEIEALFEEFVADLVEEHGDGVDKGLLREQIVGGWFANYSQGGRLALYRARGCDDCDHGGYKGRIALHELLTGSQAIKRLIVAKATVLEIVCTAYKEGMRTLKQDGIEKIWQGHTDIRQVRAVCVK